MEGKKIDIFKETGQMFFDECQRMEMSRILDDEQFSHGEKLQKLRIVAELTQKDLAEILKITQSLVSQWEKDIKKPSPEMVINLADLYEFDLEDFVNEFGFYLRRPKNKE